MIYKNFNRILWFITIVTLWMFANAKTGVSRMKALVLYAQFPMKSITNSLRSYDIDYQEWDVTKLNENEKLTPKLYDDGKRPIYFMIIIDGSLEIYNPDNNVWESVLSLDQWKELDDYEMASHARRVIVNNFTKPKIEGQYIYYDEKQMITQDVVSASNNYALKIFNDARIKRSAPLTSEGLVHSGLEYSKDKGIIPILYFKPTKSVIKKTLAAAIINQEDGREIFSFFIQFTEDSLTSTMLNHLWIIWASRSLIPGHRRVFFNPQIENVFLSSRIVDETMEDRGVTVDNFENALSKKYRSSVHDFEKIIEFVKNLNKNGDMTVGSKLQIELAFNGDGIHQYLDSIDTPSHDIHARSTEGKLVAIVGNKILNASSKSQKTEKEILLEEISKYWNTRHETLSEDELFNFFNDINIRKEFNWVSNTFSNDVFVNTTQKEVRDEVLNNLEVAMHLGLLSKDLSNSENWWSKGSIGTKGSLGFTDQTVVNTFKDFNIHYGLGNRHREDIVNHDNDYLPFISPFNNFYVIPRDKRLALRWSSSPLQTIWLYKKFYKEDYFSETTNTKKSLDEKELNQQNLSDWFKILDIESEDAVQSLLSLKHDPFVFNQANIRINDSKTNDNNSIMAQWLQATIQKYNAYVHWPMISSKSDDLAKYYVDRALRKDCGIEYSYSHNETHILSIQVVSRQACRVPITVAEGVKKNLEDNAFTYEKIGNDPLTVWIDLPGDSVTKIIPLEPALSYNDRSIFHLSGDSEFDAVDSGTEGDDETEENPEQKIMEKINVITKPVKKVGKSKSKSTILASTTTTSTKPLTTQTSTPTTNSIKSNMERILNSHRRIDKRSEIDPPFEHHMASVEDIYNKIIQEHRPHNEEMRERITDDEFRIRHKEAFERMLDHVDKMKEPHHEMFKKIFKERLNRIKEEENHEQSQKNEKETAVTDESQPKENIIRRSNQKLYRRNEVVEDINPNYYISEMESGRRAQEAMNIKFMKINDIYLKKAKQERDKQ